MDPPDRFESRMWPNLNCDEPGCQAFAEAVVKELEKKP
jgi:Na+-translocating ferredoxin:NAD+ oxidoreductase RNF subunit RnfB